MIASAQRAGRTSRRNGSPEPLENGEHLVAPEFLRRYEAMPHTKKAELIEGIVYMGSPVRYTLHGQPDALINYWLSHYALHTPGVECVANTTTQIDSENVPQPDQLLRIIEECGGQSRVNRDDYLAGAPEMVVEIAASSTSIDLREKLRAYQRNGVREYLTWRTVEAQFDWRVLTEGEFRLLPPDAGGVFRSSVFAGLWLPLKAALKHDAPAILSCLERGLRSAEHKAFVGRLAAAKRRA